MQLLLKRKKELEAVIKNRDIHGAQFRNAVEELRQIDRLLGKKNDEDIKTENRIIEGLEREKREKRLRQIQRILKEQNTHRPFERNREKLLKKEAAKLQEWTKKYSRKPLKIDNAIGDFQRFPGRNPDLKQNNKSVDKKETEN